MIQFANFCKEIEVEIKTQMIQNEIFNILNSTLKEEIKKLPSPSKRSKKSMRPITQFLKLAERFNFNVTVWEELL